MKFIRKSDFSPIWKHATSTTLHQRLIGSYKPVDQDSCVKSPTWLNNVSFPVQGVESIFYRLLLKKRYNKKYGF